MTKEKLKEDLIEEYQVNTFSEDEDFNEIEDNSDEIETQSNEFEDNEIEQNNKVADNSEEDTLIETAKEDNLENSSDDEKIL